MSTTFQKKFQEQKKASHSTMKALVFRGPNQIGIVTTLCPGGKERMRRLMELVRHGRLDLTPLLTHTFSLDQITEAYKLFGERREGVIKVAIKP